MQKIREKKKIKDKISKELFIFKEKSCSAAMKPFWDTKQKQKGFVLIEISSVDKAVNILSLALVCALNAPELTCI